MENTQQCMPTSRKMFQDKSQSDCASGAPEGRTLQINMYVWEGTFDRLDVSCFGVN